MTKLATVSPIEGVGEKPSANFAITYGKDHNLQATIDIFTLPDDMDHSPEATRDIDGVRRRALYDLLDALKAWRDAGGLIR